MEASGIFSIVLLIIVFGLSAYIAHITGNLPQASESSAFKTLFLWLSNAFQLSVLYTPNALFMYGFIADITSNKYQYSVSGITALMGMLLNKAIGKHFVGGIATASSYTYSAYNSFMSSSKNSMAAASAAATATSFSEPKVGGGDTNLCSLPGFEWLENKTAPQGIIMSMTVLWYLLIEMWDTGQTSNTLALGMSTLVFLLLQWSVMHYNGCLKDYTYGEWSILIALVMAITFAGTSYGVQKTINKYVPFVISGNINAPPIPKPGVPGTFVCPPGTHASPDGLTCRPVLGPGGTQQTATETIISVGGKTKQSEPVDDNDQFVCEAYKDGELVTSTIVE